jgi:hypothetical protein
VGSSERSFVARYEAFGLIIASQMLLPELHRIAEENGQPVDVEIWQGDVAPGLEGACLVEPGVLARENTLLLDNEVARYLIRDGRQITVEPKAGSSEREVRAFLLGTAFGALYHQRGLLPLHANAVELDGRAFAFVGPSRVGKSTLAAQFQRRGLHVLCDDVCVVNFDGKGQAIAWPGVPRIKLWIDALSALGRDPGDLERIFDDEDKFSLPASDNVARQPVPLTRVYALRSADPDEPSSPARLYGASAVTTVMQNIYRLEFATPLRRMVAQFANAVALAQSTEVYDAPRRWGYDVIDDEVDSMLRHISSR